MCTAVSFLLRGRPVIPSLVNLVVGDEELLSDLLVWYLKKKGYTRVPCSTAHLTQPPNTKIQNFPKSSSKKTKRKGIE
jgi:hypothetical protein